MFLPHVGHILGQINDRGGTKEIEGRRNHKGSWSPQRGHAHMTSENMFGFSLFVVLNLSTDILGYSDTLGTWERCHCKQIFAYTDMGFTKTVTVSRLSL